MLGVAGLAGLAIEILREISEEGPLGPGDAAARLGLPRYKVLAAFHVLEELGLIEKVYSKGSYKIYAVTIAGKKLVEAALAGVKPATLIERGILSRVDEEAAPASSVAIGEDGVNGMA